MTWQHPSMLWLLAAVGALVGLYALALLLLALGAIAIGTARPVIPWATPAGTPVVIIIDVSRSMEENDVLPSRIEASKTAALEFVNDLPRQTRIALVSFGSSVTVVAPLTGDRRVLREGIRNLTTQLRTQPRAIAILLSDGRASDGIPPMEAAREARRRGVRVHTVGVATTKDPTKLRSGYWGVLDDDTLRAIAAETGGRYYHADAAGRLREIYRELARAVGWERRPTEVTAVAGAVAMALLVASVVLRYAVYQIQ